MQKHILKFLRLVAIASVLGILGGLPVLKVFQAKAFAEPTVEYHKELTNQQEWKLYLYTKVVLEDKKPYKDFLTLRDIAQAESSWNQFDEDGEVLHGYLHYCDTGLFQINMCVHKATVDKLGMNVDNPYGNIDYALYLYRTQGFSPWGASRHSWN